MLSCMSLVVLVTTLGPSYGNSHEKTDNSYKTDWKMHAGKVPQFGQDYHVFINTASSLLEVDKNYLSLGFPARFANSKEDFNPRNTQLLTLTKALAPAYLRIGGTLADFLIFEVNETLSNNRDDRQNTSVILESVHTTFTSRKNLTNFTMTADQLGEDYMSLLELLSSDPDLAGHFNQSLVVGPEVSKPKKRTLSYLRKYLDVVGDNVHKVAFHQYYKGANEYVNGDFLDPQLLDNLIDQIESVVAVVRAANVSRPVWLSETSSFSGGGVPDMSDSYKAGFMWLDKLGVSARYGVDVVIRQTLCNGNYTMLSPYDFTPYPDYWLSLLYKRLVGRQVLDRRMSGANQTGHVRVYAHCTNPNSQRYKRGSVTLYALNLLDKTSTVVFTDPRLMSSKKEIYWLTPHGPSGLLSKEVELNGVKLEMIDEVTLPDLLPQKAPRGSRISLPRQSFGFIVFPDALSPACQGL